MKMIVVFFLVLFMGEGQGKERPKSNVPVWTLLLSSEDSQALLYRLRTSRDKAPASSEKTEVDNLNMSGSAQFSASQLPILIDYLATFGFSPSQIVIVDLREEPHAFINGHAVRWYAQDAWWTRGSPLKMVLDDEKDRLSALSLGHEVSVSRIVHKNQAGQIDNLMPQCYKIKSLMTEAQVVSATGASYVRLPVTDHMRPEDKDVDQFLIMVKNLPPQTWIHFHCHRGRGRTSTFETMYRMLRNRKIPLETLINQQVQLGSLDVRHLSRGRKAHKNANEKDRHAFINRFYTYLNAKDGYGVTSWTKWVMQRQSSLLALKDGNGSDYGANAEEAQQLPLS